MSGNRVNVPMLLAAGACWLLAGCPQPQQECVDKSKKPLEECKLEVDKLQSEIVTLKKQLAQALANPGTVQIPEQEIQGEHKKTPVKEGSLSQEEMIRTIARNKPQLKQCYERALKKSARLQTERITLNIAFKIMPTGVPTGISIRPALDYTMNDCMKKSIKRWRFPAFTGQPVDVESPFSFSPKR